MSVMDGNEPNQEKMAMEIHCMPMKISAWSCMFEAMDQETAVRVEIPSQAMGEAGSFMQRSILNIP